MKKYISLFSFFALLLTCNAFAGTTSLTTYYPAPTAAYNTVKLATNSPTTCDGSNDGAVFISNTTGTFNVCIGGQATVYPQESFNIFCSYDSTNAADPNGTTTCASYINGTKCPTGFSKIWVGPLTGLGYDQFKISANTGIISTVCSTNSTGSPSAASCTSWSCSYPSSTLAPCGEIGAYTCEADNSAQWGGTGSVVGTIQGTCKMDFTCGTTCTNGSLPCPTSTGGCSAMVQGANGGWYCPNQ